MRLVQTHRVTTYNVELSRDELLMLLILTGKTCGNDKRVEELYKGLCTAAYGDGEDLVDDKAVDELGVTISNDSIIIMLKEEK